MPSRDVGIKNEREQKEGEQWRMLNWANVVHNFSQSHLKWAHWGKKEKILQQPAGTCFLHPSLHWQNLLDGEHTWHSTAKRRSEGRSERGAKGIQRGQEMLRAIYLSSEMLEIARRWLHGAARKREGKLIGLCLFIPDTLLNQSWQASKRRGRVWWGR